MSLGTCITVDSACDLPQSFIESHNIRVLPISLQLGDKTFRDVRDPTQTIQMYNSQRLSKTFNAESIPASVAEISSIFERDIALAYDNVIAITISSKRSDVYKNIRESVFVGSQKFKELRKQQGNNNPFKIKVIDSEALFPGQGLLAFAAAQYLKEGSTPVSDIVTKLERLKSGIHGYLLPDNLFYLKNRARTKGDKSVSWLSYQLGNVMDIKPIIHSYHGDTATVDKVRGFDDGLKNLFNRANEAMKKGLTIRAINMSYAGNPKAIENNELYQDFIGGAKAMGITTLLSVMSTTAAVNVGPGAFSLAYAEK